MESVDVYKIIKTDGRFVETNWSTFEAKPNEKDYGIGFIYRYFSRKRNETFGTIYEIDKKVYDELSNSPFFIVIKLKWKIAGGNKFEVEQLNQRSISYSQETMSNIDTYVKNLTKFYRG